MKKFQLNATIYEIDTVREFAEEFKIGSGDMVFTHNFLHADYFVPLNLSCDYLIMEDYGLGEPSDVMIDKILSEISDKKIDRLFGVGGGTVLDISKLLCVKDAKTTDEIFDDKIPLVRERGLILVPTTCGTGCEVTCVSVVDMTKRGSKIGKRVEANFADSAVLIPQLLEKLPDTPFLYSSADALIHAMEIYLAPTTNSFNDAFCTEAIRIILSRYQLLAKEGLAARGKYLSDFMLASCYAGVALSNTVCGAVHACAMHFGSTHHVPHGESNYRFLSAVFQKYAELSPKGRIQNIVEIVNGALGISADAKGAFDALQNLLEKLLPDKKLRDYGVKQEDIPAYVDKVLETQQRLLVNSYVELSRDDLIEVYQKIY